MYNELCQFYFLIYHYFFGDHEIKYALIFECIPTYIWESYRKKDAFWR
jgi:hypothetical protein